MRPNLHLEEEFNAKESSDESFETSGNAENVGYANSVSLGEEMQTSAHSMGLLFEQSVQRQNDNFIRGFSSFSQSMKAFLKDSKNLKGTQLELRNALTKTALKHHPEMHLFQKYK